MRKRSLLLLITFILVLLVAGFLWQLGYFGRRYFGVSVVRPQVIESLSYGIENCIDYDRILFDGKPVIRDEANKEIFVSVDLSDKGLKGIFTAKGGKLFFEKCEAFNNPRQAVADGEVLNLWYVGKDICFSTRVVVSGLPIMSLDALYDVGEETWGGAMTLLDPSQTGAEYIKTTAEFAYRGNISKSFEKKGYKLSLSDKKISLCGLRKDDDWTLNALYDDIGLVRNATCMRLWNEISALNSVSGDRCCEGRYVELVVDGEYRGLYLLCERIDRKMTGVGADDFLFKFQVYAGEDTLKNYNKCFTVEEPKIPAEDKENLDAAKALMLDFMWKTYVPTADRTTYEEISKKVYLDNAADYLIFCLATSANDNRYKNSYFGAIKQEDASFKFYELPWDMNATFGTIYGFKFEAERALQHNTWSYVGGTLYHLAPEEFGAYVYERYKLLRQSVLSEENMKGIVEENMKTLENSGAVKRNYELFPHYRGNKKDIDYKELFTRTQIQDYIDVHMPYMDEYMERIGKGEASPDVPGIYNSDNL